MTKPTDIHTIQVRAAEKAVCDALPGLLGITRAELDRRMNAPYVWPTNEKGQRLPRGDCSACRTIDKRHPEGTACDYSCVGV